MATDNRFAEHLGKVITLPAESEFTAIDLFEKLLSIDYARKN